MNPLCPSKPILVEGNPLDQAIVLSVGRVLLHFALVIEDGLFLKESIAGMGRPMQNENPYIYIIYIYILYIVYIYIYVSHILQVFGMPMQSYWHPDRHFCLEG